MVLANIIQNLASAFELFLLGRIGIDALAAIAIVLTSVYGLNLSVHGGLINGAIAILSRYAGAKRHDDLNKALGQIFIFAVLVFGVFSFLIYIFLDPILVFFGAKGDVLIMASGYIKIMLLGFLPFSVYTIGMVALRSLGDSVTPLKVIIVMMVFNIILNPIFIVAMNLGVKGAALSGLVMNIAAAVYYIIIFTNGIHLFRLKWSDFKPDFTLLKMYAGLSLKSIGQGFIGDAGNLAMLKIISAFGNPMIAGYGIGGRLFFYILMFGWPIGNSGALIVGQNLGMKIKERVRQTVVETIKVFGYITVPAALIFIVFARPIVQLFTHDDVVIKYGVYYLRVISVFMPFFGAGLNIQSIFNGAGATGTPTVVTFVSSILVRVPLAMALPLIPALAEYGIFWAVGISMAVYSVIYVVLYNRGRWMNKEI